MLVAPENRADSWASALSPEQQWALYDHHYKVVKGKWELTVAFAESEFEIERPGRSAFYDWLRKMNGLEDEHRAEVRARAEIAARKAADGLKIDDETAREAVTARLLDAALVADNPEVAEKFGNLAMIFIKQAEAEAKAKLRQQEIELQRRSQKTKENALALARDKFEFDAAKRAMELAAEIKTVSADDTLGEDEKIRKVREALFG